MTALASTATPTGPLPGDHGRFRWEIERGQAVWSESVYRLYGYRPGQVVPSSALGFSHKHPDDLPDFVDAVHAGMLADRLIVHEHRVVDLRGAVRRVVVVARSAKDQQGRVQTLYGFLLPLPRAAGQESESTAAPARAALVLAVMTAFRVSRPAADVLVDSRRPLTTRTPDPAPVRSLRPTAIESGSQLGRTIADSMFPLHHLVGTTPRRHRSADPRRGALTPVAQRNE
jgi:PAS fold